MAARSPQEGTVYCGFDLDQMQMSAEEAAVTEVSVPCDAALCQITLDTLVPFPHYERKK